MSLILDALRKSEQERRQASDFVLAPVGHESMAPPRGRGRALALVGVMAVGVAAFAGYWLASGARSPTVSLRAAIEPSAPASAGEAQPGDATPALETERPRAPEFTPSPFAANAGGEVRDLAEEARVSVSNRNAVVAAPRVPAPVAVAAAPTRAAVAPSTVKFLRSMPLEFQRALPELVVNIHIYSPQESERILYINNRQYRAGERVRDDIVVEEIVEDGAVLSFRGQRFKLPRPS